MQKVAKLQAQMNAIKHGDDAAMGTVETVLLLIAVIVVVSVVFVFLTTKLKGGVDNVDTVVDNAKGYVDGSEIPAKA